METSAKDSTNVQTAFERVLGEIYKIATKSAVKEVKQNGQTVSKGKKLEEGGDAEPAEEQKRVKLSRKKVAKKKGGCC